MKCDGLFAEIPLLWLSCYPFEALLLEVFCFIWHHLIDVARSSFPSRGNWAPDESVVVNSFSNCLFGSFQQVLSTKEVKSKRSFTLSLSALAYFLRYT